MTTPLPLSQGRLDFVTLKLRGSIPPPQTWIFFNSSPISLPSAFLSRTSPLVTPCQKVSRTLPVTPFEALSSSFRPETIPLKICVIAEGSSVRGRKEEM